MLRQLVFIWNVIRHLAERVHVVGECDQAGLDLVIGEDAESVAYHGGARDFAEGADMRQAGWAVAGLEDHFLLRSSFQPCDNLASFLERPGVRLLRDGAQV